MADEKFEAMVERARQVVITSMTELTSVGELARIMAQFAAGEVAAALTQNDTEHYFNEEVSNDAKRHRLHEAMAAIKEYLDHTDE